MTKKKILDMVSEFHVSTGGPRIRDPLFKVALSLESFFCDHASDYILNFMLKSQDWNDKVVMA